MRPQLLLQRVVRKIANVCFPAHFTKLHYIKKYKLRAQYNMAVRLP